LNPILADVFFWIQSSLHPSKFHVPFCLIFPHTFLSYATPLPHDVPHLEVQVQWRRWICGR
jgi:hypothetical protein